MIKIKPAQSILEYAILIAIVIAAIVVMQVYMKRGISGRLKESSDKISGGEAFSASGTTTKQTSTMTQPRIISEETGTDDQGTATGTAGVIQYTNRGNALQGLGAKAYSAGATSGGDSTSNSATRTMDASREAFHANAVAQDTDKSEFHDFQAGETVP